MHLESEDEDSDGRTRARCWRTYGEEALARFPLPLLRTGPASPGALIRSRRDAMARDDREKRPDNERAGSKGRMAGESSAVRDK